jgi:3-hydroxyisobutyrate dehydrogenase-like beta-hydroxyacid dehydrogenase
MASNNEDIRGVFAPGARIAVFGAGRMGLPISGNLKAAGYDVVVSDIRSEVAEAVMAQGARWEPVAAAAVTGADIVITVLPGVREILELTAGDGHCFRRLAPTPPGLTSPPVLHWL